MNNKHDRLTVAVPSGNFGNALAAYVAGRMGLNIRVVVATNQNDVLAEYFTTGCYRIRQGDEVQATQSPSMDIASASNFERYMFEQVGRSPEHTQDLWSQLSNTNKFCWHHKRVYAGEPDFLTGSATDDEVRVTIKQAFRQYGLIIDPHTAVALKVAWDKFDGDGLGPWLVTETAQPAKFSDAIEAALGFPMQVPESCRHLMNGEDKITRIEETDPVAIAAAVKIFINANVA